MGPALIHAERRNAEMTKLIGTFPDCAKAPTIIRLCGNRMIPNLNKIKQCIRPLPLSISLTYEYNLILPRHIYQVFVTYVSLKAYNYIYYVCMYSHVLCKVLLT